MYSHSPPYITFCFFHHMAKMHSNFLTSPEIPHERHIAYHPLCLMQREEICYRAQPESGSQAEAVWASLFDRETWTRSAVWLQCASCCRQQLPQEFIPRDVVKKKQIWNKRPISTCSKGQQTPPSLSFVISSCFQIAGGGKKSVPKRHLLNEGFSLMFVSKCGYGYPTASLTVNVLKLALTLIIFIH